MLINQLDLFYGKVNRGHPCIGMGKMFRMSFAGKNLKEMGKGTEDIMILKKNWTPGICFSLSWAKYMYHDYHNLLL